MCVCGYFVCDPSTCKADSVASPSFLYSGCSRVLQGEYRRLKWKHEEAASVPMLTESGEGDLGSPTASGQQDEELLAEARVLRQHKTRLETRMQILEDHNKQLESQLRRLRELLLQVVQGAAGTRCGGGRGGGHGLCVCGCGWEGVSLRELKMLA